MSEILPFIDVVRAIAIAVAIAPPPSCAAGTSMLRPCLLGPCVQVVGNEEDCDDVLGIKAGKTDVHSGALEIARYPDVARQVGRSPVGLRLTW